jgi:methylmalonyl-CoA/ethylmalonyl-CoA epimerase
MGIFKRLDHVSIGVNDMAAARRLFIDVLGGEPLRDVGTNADEHFQWVTFLLGGKKMEIVAATEPGQGGVGRYLAKRGEGFHHISISVENLEQAIAYFEANNIRVLSPNTVDPNWKHCYLHPQDTHGALVQVFEENEKTLSHAQ